MPAILWIVKRLYNDWKNNYLVDSASRSLYNRTLHDTMLLTTSKKSDETQTFVLFLHTLVLHLHTEVLHSRPAALHLHFLVLQSPLHAHDYGRKHKIIWTRLIKNAVHITS